MRTGFFCLVAIVLLPISFAACKGGEDELVGGKDANISVTVQRFVVVDGVSVDKEVARIVLFGSGNVTVDCADGLNSLLERLYKYPQTGYEKRIWIEGNPGYDNCDTGIASAKGWTLEH